MDGVSGQIELTLEDMRLNVVNARKNVRTYSRKDVCYFCMVGMARSRVVFLLQSDLLGFFGFLAFICFYDFP